LLARELAPGQKISALSVFGLSFVASITAAIMLGVLTEKAAVRLSKSSRVKLTRLSESRAVDDQVMFKRRVAAFVGAQVLNVAVGLLMILLGNILSEYLVL
jgi:fluoride ion exporter CrcB/FEX